MRVSIWKQDNSGARWRRIGVAEIEHIGCWPFKRTIYHHAVNKPRHWPRYEYAPLEIDQLSFNFRKGGL